jgi:hypothetical protein
MTTAGWAAKAADAIIVEVVVDHLRNPQQTIASIISAHAAPLVALLRDVRREHRIFCDTQAIGCGLPCCTCGAGPWNARVDERGSGKG